MGTTISMTKSAFANYTTTIASLRDDPLLGDGEPTTDANERIARLYVAGCLEALDRAADELMRGMALRGDLATPADFQAAALRVWRKRFGNTDTPDDLTFPE